MSPNRSDTGVVVFRRTGREGEIDAIDQYSQRLVAEMAAAGVATRYVPDSLAPLLSASERPAWILLQYNPFRYGRASFAPRLPIEAARLRRGTGVPLAVMVHEAWLEMIDIGSTVVGLWQRAQLRGLLRLADAVITSTETLARELGGKAVHVPVASNINPLPISSALARERLGLEDTLTVTLFGRRNPGRALGYAEAAIQAIADAHGSDGLTILNLGADAPPVRVPAKADLLTPGPLAAEELSHWLRAGDLVLLPFVDGASTRRGTLMAALAHGRPVLGINGCNTDGVLLARPDALSLTPAGDIDAFAGAAVEFAGDSARRRSVGEAGRQLYEAEFDWPHVVSRVIAAIEPILPRRTSDMVVATA